MRGTHRSPAIWSVTKSTLQCLVYYSYVIMGSIASQITSLTIVYSSVYSGAYQRKHQTSASLAFVRIIHRRPVNSPHKRPVTRKMFSFDEVTMMNKMTHLVVMQSIFRKICTRFCCALCCNGYVSNSLRINWIYLQISFSVRPSQ